MPLADARGSNEETGQVKIVLDGVFLSWYDSKKCRGWIPVWRFSLFFRRRPKPRCPVCRKLNRVYLTGGSYLSKCVHCGAPLRLEKTPAHWGVLVFLGVCALALAVAIPLLYVR